jgi:hypothetical protein
MPKSSGGKTQRPQAAETSDPLFAEARVLIVGIDEYLDPDAGWFLGSTRGAVDDAKALESTLLEIGYARERVECLCDAQASCDVIRGKLLDLRRGRTPLLLLFWAGHGYADARHKSFLLPHDADLDRLEATALPVDEVIDLARTANAFHKAIFVDTCYAAPKSERHFLPKFSHLDLASTYPALAFAGASTYEALGQAGTGGILASCLREALTGGGVTLCDDQGAIHLDGVIRYLQQHVQRRATAAWRESGRYGDGPQRPYFSFQPGDEPVPVGRCVALHLAHAVEAKRLPASVKDLAAMVMAPGTLSPWPETGELALQLLRLARGRIEPAAYVEAHAECVRRILISWSQEPALEPYVPRLLHYCLDGQRAEPDPVRHTASSAAAAAAAGLVRDTFQHIIGQFSTAELVSRLRARFAVLDKLNSVPWAYAIRVRRGSGTPWLAPVVAPGVSIDPGREISRTFRTTCADQAYARIELFAGPETGPAEGRLPLLTRRVRLPGGLTRGEEVEIGIQRVGEAAMRLELRLCRRGRAAAAWWWIEDSAGFAELAAEVKQQALMLEQETAETWSSLKLLLRGYTRFLGRSGLHLAPADRDRLLRWVQETAGALERRDEEGLKNALRLLFEDLDAVRHESTVVVLETLLSITGAPRMVTVEFERLAAELFERAAAPDDSPSEVDAARRRLVLLVIEWNGRWQSQPSHGRERKLIVQTASLMDLYAALADPERREEALVRIVSRQPFTLGFLYDFIETYRSSRWTRALRPEERELMAPHLEVIEQLVVRSRHEEAYYAELFQRLTAAVDLDLPAEARELLRRWRALLPETTYHRVIPPSWIRQAAAAPPPLASPPDDELLESVPDGAAAEEAPEAARPLTAPRSPAAPSGAPHAAARAGDGAADGGGAAAPRP